MNSHLFKDFQAISSKQWKQKIQFELDGEDYNEYLVWNSPENIKVKPFYHGDDNIKPYTIRTNASSFKICQEIFVFDIEKSTARALDSIQRGAESLCFTVENSSLAIAQLLEKLPLEDIAIYFNLKFLSVEFVKTVSSVIQKKKSVVYFNIDPIGQLAKDGNWFPSSEKSNFETLNLLSKPIKTNSFISINTALYQNAGANMVQQIAYGVAHANEYFNRISNIETPLVFQVAIGGNYFFEIAKLRALRLLFQTVAKEYGHIVDCHIFATPSRRNKTLYDSHTNMLRTTSECMSAILGGADTISNLPYDSLFHKNNEFGDRIARNQLLILKNESQFDKVNNPADGSYYIETLTNQLADKALLLFKEIEANGGFLKQLNEGTIKRKIQESADQEQILFDLEKEVLVGSNKYVNPQDKMKENIELYPFVKIKPRKTLITPIIEKRLAEKLEQQRLASE